MENNNDKDPLKWHQKIKKNVKGIFRHKKQENTHKISPSVIPEDNEAASTNSTNAEEPSSSCPPTAISQDENGFLCLNFADEKTLEKEAGIKVEEIVRIEKQNSKTRDTKKQASMSSIPILSIPKMNICILVVGTQGDVQPFVGLGKRLRKDGHRVRLATHEVYRTFVTDHQLEFYPLGGDPKELASYMVKTGGHLLPTGIDALTHDIPRNMEIIEEILQSTWPAVSQPDGPNGKPFVANAIISNPVTYGHVHVAEKLGVPLHIMFPQPWVPTKYFPHPLSNLPYDGGEPSLRNFMSYKAVDAFMWEGTSGMINRFRSKVLSLRKIRKGEAGRNILLDLKIPHSFMWSPAVVPKPLDWDDHYDVVGTLLLNDLPSTYCPPVDLQEFLAKESAPIFIGFGSMMIEKPAELSRMIISAAAATNSRVIIQSSWSDMSSGGDDDGSSSVIPENVYFLGKCPHDWLFNQVCAVVHHGGAGTCAAGLLGGKPTWICPFFGDQPFWGRAVVDAGVGVEPTPITEMTTERMITAFESLRSESLRDAAEKLQKVLQAEDGVGEAVKSFYRQLPLNRMRCDLDPSKIATRWLVKDCLKVSEFAEFAVLTSKPEFRHKRVIPYHSVNYGARGPMGSLDGVSRGAGVFVHEIGGGVKDLVALPAEGFKKHGPIGVATGVVKGIGAFLIRPAHGLVLWADQVATGVKNKHNRRSGEALQNSVFDERIRVALLQDDDGSDKNNSCRSRLRKADNVVMVRVNSVAKEKLLHSLQEVLKNEERLNQYDNNILHASHFNSKWDIVSEGTATSSMDVEYDEESDDDDDDLTHQNLNAVSSAFYKSDGTLQLEFTHDFESKDVLGGNCMEKLKKFSSQVEESILRQKEVEKSLIVGMNICIMMVGTLLELKPFMLLGQRLQEDGHRVRFATHEHLRSVVVTELGLEFYPLAGDAESLALCSPCTWVKIQNGLYSDERLKMMQQMILSTWPAASEADPHSRGLNSPGSGFRADAIISNPMTFGHVHVAERLGIPLHIMSTHPSVPTRAFPHCLSGLPFDNQFRRTNFLSYKLVDRFMWQAISGMVNELRTSMDLKQISTFGESRRNLMTDLNIPHTFLWSPTLVQRPLDWNELVDVVGNISTMSMRIKSDNSGISDLFNTHDSNPVIYINFSYVTEEATREILKALVEAKEFLFILKMPMSQDQAQNLPGNVYILVEEELPAFAWSRVSAVIHHGHPTSCHESLQAGKPTLVCPLYSGQTFWGNAVKRAGAGLAPIKMRNLTSAVLTDAFELLTSSALKESASALAKSVSEEDGLKGAVDSFYRHLPMDAMRCDLNPTQLAHTYDEKLQLKLSYTADYVVHQIPEYRDYKTARYKPLKYSSYSSPVLTLSTHNEPPKDGDEFRRNILSQSLENFVIQPLNGSLRWVDGWANAVKNRIISNENSQSKYYSKQASVAALVVEQPRVGETEAEDNEYRSFILKRYMEKTNAVEQQVKHSTTTVA